MTFCQQNAVAEQNLTHLIVCTKDGSYVGYSLIEEPTLSFTNSDFVITTPNVDINYPLSDITQITYSDNWVSGVADLCLNKQELRIESENIVLSCPNEHDHIFIFSITGKLMFEKPLQEKGEYKISLSQFHKGVYIVKTINNTYKISIK